MKKIIIALAIGVVLTSCKGKSISKEIRGDYKVELLFEKDGCKMYRFYDGKTIYWCDCSGQTSYNTGGKNNVHIQEITTP